MSFRRMHALSLVLYASSDFAFFVWLEASESNDPSAMLS